VLRPTTTNHHPTGTLTMFFATLELVGRITPSDHYNRIMGMLIACGTYLGGRDYALDGKVFRCFPTLIEVYSI